MSSRDELREALREALYQAPMHADGVINAVLAVLDQQGWPQDCPTVEAAEPVPPVGTASLLPRPSAKGAVTCGICGMPQHRFGLGDPHHKYDAMACVNMLLPEPDRLRAALREAARYEPLTERMHEGDCDWIVWCYKPELFDDSVPDEGPDCSCEPDLYRRVTTTGED